MTPSKCVDSVLQSSGPHVRFSSGDKAHCLELLMVDMTEAQQTKLAATTI